MDTQTQTGTGNEEFGLKVKALIKSREQLKEQNAQLEQRISDLQSLIKSKAIPPEPEPQAAQPVIPAVAPAAPYAAPQPILSPAPAQPFYQPQTQPQPAYTPQTQPQPAYTPPVF
ncbi:MAG: hypothetical protein FWC62_05780, partial [Firmicutes bacterium]|nr:hypothetical protein [Bacillota bacterium]